MKKIYVNTWFLIVVLYLTGTYRTAIAQTNSDADELQKSVTPILTDPAFADFSLRQFSWREQRDGHIVLPAENADHAEGVFWINAFDVAIPAGNPPRVYAYGKLYVRVIDGQHLFPSEDEARQVGLQFLKRRFSWFFQKGVETSVNIIRPTINSLPSYKGLWSFEWSRLDAEGLPTAEADVMVRAIDGKVVGFSVRPHSWPEHKIKFSRAKQIALELAGKDSQDVEVIATAVIESEQMYRQSGLPKAFFRLFLRAKDKVTRAAKTAVLLVDADVGKPLWIDFRSGEPVPEKISWRTSKASLNEKRFAKARFPLWIDKGLSFVALQDLAGMPDWVQVPPQLFVKTTTGISSYLTSDLGMGQEAQFTSSLPGSSWIGVAHAKGWTYAIDTSNGDYRVLGTPERLATTPAVAPDGAWAIVAATGHTGNAGFDLFADHISARGPELQLRARLVIPGSDEHHPIYSPDGKSLYFVSTKQEKDKVTHALRRLPSAIAQAQELTQVQPAQIETIVAALPADVQRISFFADGKQLLLQTDKGIFTVTVAVDGSKVTPLVLPKLQDAELGNSPLQEIGDAWAGPGNDEVTFSGKTVDADKKERRRIYSCRFDGTNLKALTPAENKPVPAYQFPEGKKTAYELAKEMALSEIAWDEKHRDH